MAAQSFRRRLRSSESVGPPSPYLQWSRLKQTRDGAIKDDRLVSSSRRRVPRYEAGMLEHRGTKDEGSGSEAASLYISVPVWPSGDWLPFLRIERATQVNGWFGLAHDPFPGARMAKHQLVRVQKLSRQTELSPARAAAILRVAAHRVPDRGQVRAD